MQLVGQCSGLELPTIEVFSFYILHLKWALFCMYFASSIHTQFAHLGGSVLAFIFSLKRKKKNKKKLNTAMRCASFPCFRASIKYVDNLFYFLKPTFSMAGFISILHKQIQGNFDPSFDLSPQNCRHILWTAPYSGSLSLFQFSR